MGHSMPDRSATPPPGQEGHYVWLWLIPHVILHSLSSLWLARQAQPSLNSNFPPSRTQRSRRRHRNSHHASPTTLRAIPRPPAAYGPAVRLLRKAHGHDHHPHLLPHQNHRRTTHPRVLPRSRCRPPPNPRPLWRRCDQEGNDFHLYRDGRAYSLHGVAA